MLRVVSLLSLAFVTVGCSDSAQIEKKARWLCERAHFQRLLVDTFPADHDPSDYIAARDLATLAEDERDIPSKYAGLISGYNFVGEGTREAAAAHSECKVSRITFDDSQQRARVEMEWTAPLVSVGDNPLVAVTEMAAFGTAAAVEKEFDRLIRESDPPMETRYPQADFEKEDGKWVAAFDIALRRKAAKIDRETRPLRFRLEKLEEKLRAADEAYAVLSKVEVVSATFARRPEWHGGLSPEATVTLRNDTGHSLSRLALHLRLMAPGQDAPIAESPFDFATGEFTAGKKQTWTLELSTHDDWAENTVPIGAELQVLVTKVEGKAGEVLAEYSTQGLDYGVKPASAPELQKQRDALAAEIAALDKDRPTLSELDTEVPPGWKNDQ